MLIQPIKQFITDFIDNSDPALSKIPWEIGISSLINNDSLNIHSFPRFFIEDINYKEESLHTIGDLGTITFSIKYIEMDPKREMYSNIDEKFLRHLFSYVNTRDDVIITDINFSNLVPSVYIADIFLELQIG